MISVTAHGFIGEKPQLQVVGASSQKVEFDVIWDRRAYSAGEWRTHWERATFFAWGEEAENIASLLEKGDNVSCTGLQETSEWIDKPSQQKRFKTKYRLTAWIKNRKPRPQGDGAQADGHDASDGRKDGGGRNSERAGQRHQPPNQRAPLPSRPQAGPNNEFGPNDMGGGFRDVPESTGNGTGDFILM